MFFKLTTHMQYVTEHASEKPILDLGKIMFYSVYVQFIETSKCSNAGPS